MKKTITCISFFVLVGIFFVSTPLFASTILSSTQIKEVALTFDDGPYGTSTQQVLNILQKEKVTATFFLIGKNVEKYPDLVKEIVQDGYIIGNHTYDHPKNLPQMSVAQLQDELSKTDANIFSTTGVHAKLFRPPYGNITKKLRKELRVEGYKTIMWNIDPMDWNYASSTSLQIEQRILSQKKPVMVIVMHDGRDTRINYPRDNMIDALPVIIDDLKQQGYQFVTVDQLSSTTLLQLK